MPKLKETETFAKKVLAEAKKELNKEKEAKYKERAKSLLGEIQEAKRITILLERQLNNFLREMELDN